MTICMPLMNSTILAGLLQTAISLITKSVSMCLYRTLQRSIQLWKYRRTDHHKCSQPALYPYHLERWRESTNRQATPSGNNVCQRIRRTTKDFTLIIDDSAVYHTLNDFRSAEARKLYQQRIQKQKDYDNLKKNLDDKREQYAQGNSARKKNLTPAILELENVLNNFWKKWPNWISVSATKK